MEKTLKDIDFTKLESVRKQCITFAKDGNTIVKPYKTLYNVEQITGNPNHKRLYFEIVEGKEAWEENKYCLFEDLEKICSKVDWIPEFWTLEKFTEQISKWAYFGKEGLLKRLQVSEENNWYINLLDIELCIIFDEIELAKHYVDYRENYIKQKEEKEAEKYAKQKAEEEKQEEEHHAEVQKMIEDAEYKIFHQEDIDNKEIDGVSIVNLLMRKHEIDVPLRTQGWINAKLATIVFTDDGISYRFYGKTQRDNSTVFRKYLAELETAIIEKLSPQLSQENEESYDIERE